MVDGEYREYTDAPIDINDLAYYHLGSSQILIKYLACPLRYRNRFLRFSMVLVSFDFYDLAIG